MTPQSRRPTGWPAPTLAVATTLTALLLLGPWMLLPRLTGRIRRRLRDLHNDQAGISDFALMLLALGIGAIIVVAVMGIIQTFVTNEANNLPSSGGGG